MQVDDDVLVEVGMGVGPVGFSVEQQDLLYRVTDGAGFITENRDRASALAILAA